jgi:hypothetical protein
MLKFSKPFGYIFVVLCMLIIIAFGMSEANAQVTGTVDSSTQSQAGANNAGNVQSVNPTMVFNQASATPFSSTEIRYSGSQTIKTVPNVIAPGLVATPASCLGSRSGGFALTGVGATGGSTYEDGPCNGREGAKVLHVMGMQDAAIERLCLVSQEREAIEAGFLKTRAAWVRSATEARSSGNPPPALKAVPRCKLDQDIETANDEQARREKISQSEPTAPAAMLAIGILDIKR